jgi:D-3-phosphoglycerate dehydrogenase
MPSVLFIDSNHPILHTLLQEAGIQCDLHYHWTEEEISKNLHLYDGLVIRSRILLGKELIDRGSKLRFIARAGAGMENIDVAYAESKGILCLNSPEGNKDAVAEHAIGMLLSLFNHLCRANREVRNGEWKREPNRGLELMGKTMGIIGYGNMGMAFAQRLKGFGVTVLAYDKYKKGFSDAYVQEVSLEKLQEEADIVSLHIPLTEETLFFANDLFFQHFAKNIYVINTARGKVLKTDDLIKNIAGGKVLGACLDVLEYESVSFERIESEKMPPGFRNLIESDKVLLSPHIAGWSKESNEKIARVLAEKIIGQINKP